MIGLTGPTGSGKSTAAAVFKRLGCAVIDADRLARLAVKDQACLDQLVREFGRGILLPDGTLDRKTLASLAFSGPEKTKRLNRILHPVIIEESVRRIHEAMGTEAKAIVMDAALLFESGADRLCDTTIAVTAPPEIRLHRIRERDHLALEEAEKRMNAQNGNEYYTLRADYVLDGNSGLSGLNTVILGLLQKIMGDRDET